MFGVNKRIERVRVDLVRAFKAKSMEIMLKHSGVPPEKIPPIDVTRAMLLNDIADIILKLGVEEIPEDKA
jgi:hypothetical protein